MHVRQTDGFLSNRLATVVKPVTFLATILATVVKLATCLATVAGL